MVSGTVPGPAIGLCADCQHCRIVQSARSTFYMCLRSLTDPGYRKYPPLPVLSCPGYDKAPDGKLTQ
jgi:hypothetical protein